MTEAERHKLIVEALTDRRFATVRDLQSLMDASAATIRRDIAKLHGTGAVRKVFGGVAAPEGALAHPYAVARPFEENRVLAVEAKKAIAAAAEALCRDGDAVIIHGGTTCYMFALRLASRSIRIYTNSMPLAATLWAKGACHLVLSGGELYREPGIMHAATMSEPEFYASRFFIGAQGIGPAGVMESQPLVVRAVARLMEQADEIVVLADSRKFALRARHVAVPLSRIGTLITDDGLLAADRQMLEDAGVRVIVASASR